MRENMKILLKFLLLFFISACAGESSSLVISIDDNKVFLDSRLSENLKGDLKLAKCSSKDKVIIRAHEGVSFQMLEKLIKQIAEAGCKEKLKLEKI